MNIRQLRYICAVAKHGLNVSATAHSLHTSQPGVSKQIRQLEDELNVQIFERSGRQLTRITEAGAKLIELAERALIELDTIKRTAQELSDPGLGELSIAASHTQAKYTLPAIIARMAERYPRIDVRLHQGTPLQIAQAVMDGVTDFAIATESLEHFEDLVMLPCYRWQRGILVPRDHALASAEQLDIETLARYPLITYVFGFTGSSPLDKAFEAAGVKPNAHLTATDADIIKTYVRQGMGVGVLARMAYEPEADSDLVMRDASHLFDPSTTRIGFRRGAHLRGFMYEFIELFAPHLDREVVDRARSITRRSALDALFLDEDLPLR